MDTAELDNSLREVMERVLTTLSRRSVHGSFLPIGILRIVWSRRGCTRSIFVSLLKKGCRDRLQWKTSRKTSSEIARLEKVNELLLDLTNHTYKRTASLVRQVLSMPKEELDDDLIVEGKLVPEFDLPSSVLRLEDDTYYGSDFVRMAAILQETEEYQPGMTDIHCYLDQIENYTPATTDEQLGCANTLDDGITWGEAWLRIPPLKHIIICHALHALVTHMNWSIPDVLRINDYKIEVTLTAEQYSDQERNRRWWWNKYDLSHF